MKLGGSLCSVCACYSRTCTRGCDEALVRKLLSALACPRLGVTRTDCPRPTAAHYGVCISVVCTLSPLLGKKKKKGKTVALHEFLADPSVGGGAVVPEPPKRTTSWADATDDIDTGGGGGHVRESSCMSTPSARPPLASTCVYSVFHHT